jgi:hypothetical protein
MPELVAGELIPMSEKALPEQLAERLTRCLARDPASDTATNPAFLNRLNVA